MSDDILPANRRDNSAIYAAIDALRADVREDIGHLRDDVREDNDRLERRLMAAVEGARQDHVEFAVEHAKSHAETQSRAEQEHQVFREFIHNAELAQARRDGALGMFRFTLEQLSRHWRPIVAIIGTLLAGLSVLTGSLAIEIVAR